MARWEGGKVGCMEAGAGAANVRAESGDTLLVLPAPPSRHGQPSRIKWAPRDVNESWTLS